MIQNYSMGSPATMDEKGYDLDKFATVNQEKGIHYFLQFFLLKNGRK